MELGFANIDLLMLCSKGWWYFQSHELQPVYDAAKPGNYSMVFFPILFSRNLSSRKTQCFFCLKPFIKTKKRRTMINETTNIHDVNFHLYKDLRSVILLTCTDICATPTVFLLKQSDIPVNHVSIKSPSKRFVLDYMKMRGTSIWKISQFRQSHPFSIGSTTIEIFLYKLADINTSWRMEEVLSHACKIKIDNLIGHVYIKHR